MGKLVDGLYEILSREDVLKRFQIRSINPARHNVDLNVFISEEGTLQYELGSLRTELVDYIRSQDPEALVSYHCSSQKDLIPYIKVSREQQGESRIYLVNQDCARFLPEENSSDDKQ
jgi:hypothetical protein